MRVTAPLVLLLLFVLTPRPASAVTVDQIVALSKAGVTDAVILALIERDHTILAIEPDQLVALKRDGVSEAVIIAMLKSGRAEGEEAARAESEYRDATIAASLSPYPETIIVGHGPDRPNTSYRDWSRPRIVSPAWSAPYAVPYQGPYAPAYESFAVSAAPIHDRVPVPARALCYAQVTSGPARSANALTYVTECPPVMQRALKRAPLTR